jgi:hypothetical protein
LRTSRQGNGGLLIDPHGDTADQIAKLSPKSRIRDFISIDPDASLVSPFNPLQFNFPKELELGKESLFTTFKSLAGSARGDESATVSGPNRELKGAYFSVEADWRTKFQGWIQLRGPTSNCSDQHGVACTCCPCWKQQSFR